VSLFKNISLRIRIFLAMILLVLLASILILGVTLYQYNEQTIDYNISRFGRKEQSVLTSIDFELKRETREPLSTETLGKIFQNRIYEISSTHKLNISIFDLEGNLIITSNTTNSFDTTKEAQALSGQVLEDLETLPSHRVFSNVVLDNISKETSYRYLTDLKSKRIGVLELKFSQDNYEEEKELTEFMIRLTYVYLFMFLIAIAIAYFLSSYITRSIKTISDKIHKTGLNKRNEKIEFNKGSSEISTLVNAYNQMIDELQESAVKLAQSEREQAWREMAKQVAHEIKNPLTPMRLSVQSFERKFDPEDPNIKEKLKEFSQTLIQQIDIMSSIASAFSDFAKMPTQKREKIDVVEVVKQALDIFNENYISYSFSEDKIIANLDKSQLIRIVTNLITNASQAIEQTENPKIQVHVSSENENIKIAVTDNGKGIDDSVKHLIFEPKFTTKTSGMGLGLPIIKKIIEANKGSINFVSSSGKGTTFTVTFPKI
jgi:two-component system nitrogen regulation sensor histidine kinase NtrY